MTLLLPGVAVLLAAMAYLWLRGWQRRRRLVARLEAPRDPHGAAPGTPSLGGPLRRWLSLAGYRAPGAVAAYSAATITAAALGLGAAWVYNRIARPSLMEVVAGIPGGTGDVFAGILDVGGWILFVVMVLGPTLVVRDARRRRVASIERDLPLALELFSTMAEAGLGFDGALARIVSTQPEGQPLGVEFATFQRDLLTGTPRLQALRRLAERTDVGAMSTFTAAVIQAEQVGASMADTLRNQAEALRDRRREQALLHAQALPVRLVFPLVICFLPGIFLSTLAPVLYQLIEVANSVLRSSSR